MVCVIHTNQNIWPDGLHFSSITVFLSWMIVCDFCVCLIKMKGDLLKIVQYLVGACYYKYYTSFATSRYGFNYGLPMVLNCQCACQ